MKKSPKSVLSPRRSLIAETFAPLALIVATAVTARSASIEWQGGTASYNTPADWVGGSVPGYADNAINDNGTNNAVQINFGDPDWTVNQILAGDGAGNGAFVQNGQNVNLAGTNFNGSVVTVYNTPFRLGVAAADTGVYTLNGGTNNYGNSSFNIGELGTGILNINGGLITGGGNFADNLGAAATPVFVTATVGGGVTQGDFTWFEQGYYTPNTSFGVPPAGTTITSVSQADHSFTMPPSYAAKNAVLIATNQAGGSISLPSVPLPCTGLSFMGQAGNGPVVVNYTLQHADGTTETGSVSVPDWYASAPAGASEVMSVGARVDALGINFQTSANVAPNTGNAPYVWSMDVAVTNTTSAVTNVLLTYVSGGTATIMAISSQTTIGGAFSPVTMGGYNADIVVEATAQSLVSGAINDVVNQTGGAVNVTGGGQLFVGNYGTATYNLSSGSVDVHNYIALGRSGGNGTLNMSGGTFNQDNGGNLLVGTGFNAPSGGSAVGVLNQSAGIINSQGQFLCPENSPSTGTYNLTGTGVLNVNNWFVIGRQSGVGTMNFSNSAAINKTGGGDFIECDGDNTVGTVNMGPGTTFNVSSGWYRIGNGNNSQATFNQNGGTVTVGSGQFLVPDHGNGSTLATYNMSGNASVTVHNWLAIGRSGGVGVINLTNGVLTRSDSGSHFDLGASGTGTLNQYGGVITNTSSDFWLGESANGTWNLNGGSAILANLILCVNGSATGTLNLNGGLIQVNGISGGNALAISTLNLNGGTLQAASSNPNFISSLTQVLVGSGGMVVDSQGYNITIGQALQDNGGGSLTKLGTGTLTLTGANTYTGNTVINAGAVITGTGSAASQSANVTAADNAGFGVIVQSAGAQYTTANVTLGSSTGASLSFDMGPFGNPSPAQAPLNVSGTFTVNGTIAVNIADALPQLGQFPLVKYNPGSLVGGGNFVVGSLPIGVSAVIVTNTPNSSIDLLIGGVNQPRWDGEAGGTWDTGSDTNWVNIGTSLGTSYTDPSAVVFDDNALGVTTVNLTTTVNPNGITVTNNLLNYSVVGTGKISGSKGLSKQGSGVLAVLNTGGNNYTGATVVNGGALIVTNLANGGSPSAIGASSASPTNLILSGGSLVYAGPTVTINRGYTITANSTIDTESNLTLSGQALVTAGAYIKTGPATLAYIGTGTNVLSASGGQFSAQVTAGTLVLDGSAGPQTNSENGEMYVGSSTNAGANLILTNTTLNCASWFAIARGTGTGGYTSTVNVYNSHLSVNNISLGYANGISGNNETANFSLNGNSTLVNNGGTGYNLGENSGSTCTMTIGGNSWMTSANRILMALASGATGNLVIQNNGALTNGGYVSIGVPGTATVTLQDNAVWQSPTDFNVTDIAGSSATPSVGTVNITNNAKLIISTLYMGKSAYCTGTINQSGGTVVNSGGGDWRVGGNNSGAVNQMGVWNFSGGTITEGDNFQVGAYGTGYFNQSGGTFTSTGGFPDIGRFPGGVGYLNISGGVFNQVPTGSRMLVGEQGTGTVNMSGTGTMLCGGAGGPGTAPDGSTGLILGLTSTGVATMNVTNGSVIVTNDTCVGRDGGSVGTLNLYGGVFSTRALYRSTISGSPVATGNINFYGGTLRAAPNANNASFMKNLSAVTLYAGGVTIDSYTNIITIAQNLGDGGGGGSLTKIGNGTLILSGLNTYSGATVVNTGTLSGAGTNVSPVTVAAGATLAVGPSLNTIGVFAVSNTVTLSAGSTNFMKVNKTGGTKDQLTGLSQMNYGGTLVISNLAGTLAPGDSFTLFNAASYSGSFSAIVPATPGAGLTWNTSQLAVNGTLSVSSGVNTNPTNILFSVSGGNLNLSWPSDHLGWRLLEQTNALNKGLGTNWSPVPNSSSVTSVAIPINALSPTVFFRLTYP